MGGDYSSVVPFQAAEKSPGRSAPPSASEKGTPCLLKVRVHSGRDGTSVERIVVLLPVEPLPLLLKAPEFSAIINFHRKPISQN